MIFFFRFIRAAGSYLPAAFLTSFNTIKQTKPVRRRANPSVTMIMIKNSGSYNDYFLSADFAKLQALNFVDKYHDFRDDI